MSYTLRSPWSLFALTVAAGLMSVSAARAAPHSQMVKPAYRYIDCSHTKTAEKALCLKKWLWPQCLRPRPAQLHCLARASPCVDRRNGLFAWFFHEREPVTSVTKTACTISAKPAPRAPSVT